MVADRRSVPGSTKPIFFSFHFDGSNTSSYGDGDRESDPDYVPGERKDYDSD